jgi:xanthine dehydrogenase accessory factor
MRNFPLGANCGQCCGGVVDIVFESISQQPPAWCKRIVNAQDTGQDCILVTPLTNGPGTDKFVFTSADPVSSTLEVQCQKLISSSGAARFVKTKHHEDSACGYLLEPISAPKLQIAVFGAGHVGTALVEVLAKLNCHVQWIDARADQFGNTTYANVEQICAPDPSSHVARLAAGTNCLVMTHSHALDFELCAKLLAREDIPFCGLIGSASKRNRFERLFRQAGFPEEYPERLTCPIGVVGINGKAPTEIAVAVAAQLLQLNHARPAQTAASTHRRQQLAALYH